MNHMQYRQILEDAIQGEIDSRQFYQDAAGRMQNEFLKDLFTRFAREEKNHEEILKGFVEDIPETLPFEENRDYRVAATVDRPQVSDKMGPADAFALAMKKEQEAMDQYNALAEGCIDPEQAQMFGSLAAMEREHKLKMEQAFVDIGYPEVW